jgi:hypothetical protein
VHHGLHQIGQARRYEGGHDWGTLNDATGDLSVRYLGLVRTHVFGHCVASSPGSITPRSGDADRLGAIVACACAYPMLMPWARKKIP